MNAAYLHQPGPSAFTVPQPLAAPSRLCMAAVLLSVACIAIAAEPPPASAPKPAASPPQSLSTSLGVYAFPAKAQSHEQQNADEAACFAWAKTQTGYDPVRPSVPKPPAQPLEGTQAAAPGGERVKGALGGAAAGAVIGAVAGDAEDGAKIGAAAGTLRGGRTRRQSVKQAEFERKKAEEAAAAQTANELARAKDNYNRAFGACLEGKGYSVK